MKLSDLEAHFYTQEYFDNLGRRKDMPRGKEEICRG